MTTRSRRKRKRKKIKTAAEREKEIEDLYSKRAVRKGDLYCAPWCGTKCTWKAYQVARRRAHALAKHMGKGWTAEVHENMGWHYTVWSPCRRIKLKEHWRHGTYNCRTGETTLKGSAIDQLAAILPDHYTAFLGSPDSSGGRWAEHGDTPEEAIRAVVAVAETKLAEIGALITGLEEWS